MFPPDVADLERQQRINVRAPQVLTQALLASLRLRRGQIVLVNSSVARRPQAATSQYAATKIALQEFADRLRSEINQDGVRVLSVFVGRTATPMQQTVHRLEGKEYRAERLLQPEDVASVVLNTLCLPRTAKSPRLTFGRWKPQIRRSGRIDSKPRFQFRKEGAVATLG